MRLCLTAWLEAYFRFIFYLSYSISSKVCVYLVGGYWFLSCCCDSGGSTRYFYFQKVISCSCMILS